ncbi:MAG: hypothetical protein ACRC46_12580, partial [Thermoguttaceae bacterium]
FGIAEPSSVWFGYAEPHSSLEGSTLEGSAMPNQNCQHGQTRTAVLLIAITVIDLVVVNRSLVPTVAHAAFDIDQAVPLARTICANHNSHTPPRLFRAVSYRSDWKTTSSPQRLEEWVRRDVATLAPRYNWLLPQDCSVDVVATASTTMLPRTVRDSLHLGDYGLVVPRDWEAVQRLQIDFFLLDANSTLPKLWSDYLQQIDAPLPDDVKLWRVSPHRVGMNR